MVASRGLPGRLFNSSVSVSLMLWFLVACLGWVHLGPQSPNKGLLASYGTDMVLLSAALAVEP